MNYLEARRELNISLLVTYVILIIAMHDPLVKLSVWAMNTISFSIYNLIIGALMIAGFTAFILSFYRNLKEIPEAKDVKIIYFMIVTGLLVLHVHVNFVMNIEIIHTLQFGLLALLIFPLTRSFGATLYYTVLLGIVDEGYQFAILYAEKSDYFDFNDVVLDQLGAGLALVYLYSTGVSVRPKHHGRWYLSPVVISMVILTATVGVLFHFSLISLYAPLSDGVWLVLNEADGPESFWRYLPNSLIVYHVLTPVEGMLIIVSICGMFFLFDYFVRKRAGNMQDQQPASKQSLHIVRDDDQLRVKSISPSTKLKLTR